MRRCRRVFCAVLEQHCPSVDVQGEIVCQVCHTPLQHDRHGVWYSRSSQCSSALVKLILVYLTIALAYGVVEEFLRRML